VGHRNRKSRTAALSRGVVTSYPAVSRYRRIVPVPLSRYVPRASRSLSRRVAEHQKRLEYEGGELE